MKFLKQTKKTKNLIKYYFWIMKKKYIRILKIT